MWTYKKLYGNELILGDLNKKVNFLIVTYSKQKGTESNANLVFKNIWLGNEHAATDIQFVYDKNIKCIINVTTHVQNIFPFVNYLKIPIKDFNACESNLLQIIEIGADTIHQAIQTNNTVLVHCKKGHHRSAAILAFYLMKYNGMNLLDSIYLIKKVRPTAFRKMTCMLQTLIYYEYNRLVKDS